jgi:hypothetical protein
MDTIDLKQQAEFGRLLTHAAGYEVRAADGKRLGYVDHLRYLEHADHPDQIAVRARFWQKPLLLSFEAVAAVEPQARTITLRPSRQNRSGISKRGRGLLAVGRDRVGMTTRMFKRRRAAPSGRTSIKIGSLVTVIGGLLEGLLFWRKRRTS